MDKKNYFSVMIISSSRDIYCYTLHLFHVDFSLPYPLAVGDDDTFNGTDVNGNQTTPYLDLVTLGTPRYNAVRRRRNAAIAGAFSTKVFIHGLIVFNSQ